MPRRSQLITLPKIRRNKENAPDSLFNLAQRKSRDKIMTPMEKVSNARRKREVAGLLYQGLRPEAGGGWDVRQPSADNAKIWLADRIKDAALAVEAPLCHRAIRFVGKQN
jgi:hypothetical protein